MAFDQPVIEIVGAEKWFGTFQALNDINLSIAQGEILTLLGPSGCGKTTLMRLIGGFEDVTKGIIRIDGNDCARVPPEKRPVNMVFQRYALFPHLDVFENIAFGLKVRGVQASEVKKRVNRMLAIVQLEPFASRYIDELSGGQCQRVALARALVNEPKVLLLDEPLAALDLKIRQHMLVEMKRIHAETGATFIYVTHDQDEAMILSDRVVLMEHGKIVQIDRPEIMYGRPRSLFAAKFLGETNLFEVTVSERSAAGISARTSGGMDFFAPGNWPEVSGNRAVVSLRPESFRFCGNSENARHVEDGVVKDNIFIGSRSFFSIETRRGHSIRLQAQRRATARMPLPGEEVRLCWEAEDVVLLPVQ